MTKDTGWDHALKVTGSGKGLVGHAGAMLLRKLADRAGLTAALGPALGRSGRFPLVDRGVALVSVAVAIALGGHQNERHRLAGAPGTGVRGCAERLRSLVPAGALPGTTTQ